MVTSTELYFYLLGLLGLTAACFLLTPPAPGAGHGVLAQLKNAAKRFRRTHMHHALGDDQSTDGSLLLVYCLAYLTFKFADWTQGPYFSAVYRSKGLSDHLVAVMFLAGFGCAAVASSFVGALADSYGRKRACVACGCIAALAGATVLTSNTVILLIGRALGGIATSLMYSAFESWLVSEHSRRQLPSMELSSIFTAVSTLDPFCAIVAGIVSDKAASSAGTVTAPFVLSSAEFLLGSIIVLRTWKQDSVNSLQTGGQATTGGPMDRFKEGIRAVSSLGPVMLLALTSMAFETAMYTFVFVWSSMLHDELPAEQRFPLGLLFSIFMAAIALGAQLLAVCRQRLRIKLSQVITAVLAISSLCLLLASMRPAPWAVFWLFVVFEGCCGIYFPAMASLRAQFVPDDVRASVSSMLRVPLNVCVAFVLLMSPTVGSTGALALSSALVFVPLMGWVLPIMHFQRAKLE